MTLGPALGAWQATINVAVSKFKGGLGGPVLAAVRSLATLGLLVPGTSAQAWNNQTVLGSLHIHAFLLFPMAFAHGIFSISY